MVPLRSRYICYLDCICRMTNIATAAGSCNKVTNTWLVGTYSLQSLGLLTLDLGACDVHSGDTKHQLKMVSARVFVTRAWSSSEELLSKGCTMATCCVACNKTLSNYKTGARMPTEGPTAELLLAYVCTIVSDSFPSTGVLLAPGSADIAASHFVASLCSTGKL